MGFSGIYFKGYMILINKTTFNISFYKEIIYLYNFIFFIILLSINIGYSDLINQSLILDYQKTFERICEVETTIKL